ncbi:MAG: acetoin utilization protein AcuC [Chloroflexota bacterium]
MLEHRSRLVYHDDFLRYDFGSHHPLRPERLVLGLDLLEGAGLWLPGSELLQPVAASDEELERVHAKSYVQAVKRASDIASTPGDLVPYGLSHGDTPAFSGMHNVSALVAGGTLEATRQILDGSIDHAFNPGGGWHHALRNRASGFCVYNDPALAAASAVREFGARVLYVDFDCHHGDGVQWIFYDDPTVMTVSFHESGRFLFPGTGETDEIGHAEGRGFSVNMPFAPYTQDEGWIEALRSVVPAAAERFRPDLLITAHGADTHIWDPLTHLCLTTDSFVEQARLAHETAHAYTRGRWLAVGSGGYDWRRVVPRSWAIVWAEMSDRTIAPDIPAQWLARHGRFDGSDLPQAFFDGDDLRVPLPDRLDVDSMNAATLTELKRALPWLGA